MAYYLTTDKRGEQKILDITESPKYKRISKLTGNRSTIEEIDEFTSKFTDEVDLKTHLCEIGVLSLEDIERPMSIRMASQGQLEKVEYDLFYSYESKYLSEDYLMLKILEKAEDNYFLEKLCTHYRNSYNNIGTITYIRNLLNTRIEYGDTDYVNKNMPKALNQFTINEICEIDKFTNRPKVDPKTGEVKIKQKSKHDLAMFVCRYNDNVERIISGVTVEELKEDKKKRLKELKEEFKTNTYTKAKTKIRVLKNEKIEGQMSLFDE